MPRFKSKVNIAPIWNPGLRDPIGSRKPNVKPTTKQTPVISQYHENRKIYRRRRAPRRVRRRAIRFSRRCEKVISNNWPDSTMTCAIKFAQSAAADHQRFFWIPLLSGWNSSSPTSGIYNQLWFVSKLVLAASSKMGIPTGVTPTELKFIIKNAVLDIQLGATGSGTNNAYPTHVKVFHLKCRRNVVSEPSTLFPDGIAEKVSSGYTLPGSAVVLDPTNPDVSPFDSSLLCRNYIVKSCTEHILQPGQTIDLQLRDRKEYSVDMAELTSTGGSNYGFPSLKRFTQGFLIVWQGGVDTSLWSGGNAGQLGAAPLSCNASVSLRFAAPQMQQATAVQYDS